MKMLDQEKRKQEVRRAKWRRRYARRKLLTEMAARGASPEEFAAMEAHFERERRAAWEEGRQRSQETVRARMRKEQLWWRSIPPLDPATAGECGASVH
jgi:hypothetical protein